MQDFLTLGSLENGVGIEHGSTSVEVVIDVLDDLLFESTEQLSFAVFSEAVTEIASTSASSYIRDNESNSLSARVVQHGAERGGESMIVDFEFDKN